MRSHKDPPEGYRVMSWANGGWNAWVNVRDIWREEPFAKGNTGGWKAAVDACWKHKEEQLELPF